MKQNTSRQNINRKECSTERKEIKRHLQRNYVEKNYWKCSSQDLFYPAKSYFDPFRIHTTAKEFVLIDGDFARCDKNMESIKSHETVANGDILRSSIAFECHEQPLGSLHDLELYHFHEFAMLIIIIQQFCKKKKYSLKNWVERRLSMVHHFVATLDELVPTHHAMRLVRYNADGAWNCEWGVNCNMW